jgi:hypothetical protein
MNTRRTFAIVPWISFSAICRWGVWARASAVQTAGADSTIATDNATTAHKSFFMGWCPPRPPLSARGVSPPRAVASSLLPERTGAGVSRAGVASEGPGTGRSRGPS